MDFILRPWLESDAKDLTIHLNNKKIWDNCRDGLPFPYTETAADAFIKYASEQVEQNEFCIEVNHEAVGNIGFVRGTDVERILEQRHYDSCFERSNRALFPVYRCNTYLCYGVRIQHRINARAGESRISENRSTS